MKYIERMSVRNLAVVTLSMLALVVLSASAAYAATTGSLRITGVVKNGTAHPSDFTLQIKSGNSTISASGDTITLSGLSATTHTITKIDGPAGYNVVWSGDCSAQGTVMIVPNITQECTATYVLGSLGSIKVNIVVKGGTATPSDFTVHLKKSGEPDTGSPSGSGSVVTFSQLAPGAYTIIGSTPPAGYSLVWSGACDSQGNVTVVGSATSTCTATNTYSSTSGGGSGRTRTPSLPRPGR